MLFEGALTVTIVRIGATKKYADNWESAFGRKKSAKVAASSAKKSAKKKGKRGAKRR